MSELPRLGSSRHRPFGFSRVAVALVVALLVSACGSAAVAPTPSPSPVTQPSPTPSPEPTPGPTATPEPRWPLTGLPLDGDPTRRPIAIRFDNATPAQPQAGLSQADIVFDTNIEACVSRLLAVYHSREPELVGSIRSARLYDLELVPMFRAALAHVGAADEVSHMIREAEARGDLVTVDAYKFHDYPAYTHHYWRIDWKGAPFNMYSSLPRLREAVREHGSDEAVEVPAWAFASTGAAPSAPQGSAVERFSLRGVTLGQCLEAQARGEVGGYLTAFAPTYTHDAAAGGWRRATQNGTTIDETTRAPILASNVIVIATDLTVTDIVESRAAGNAWTAYSVRPRTTGSGEVAIFTADGTRLVGTWSRATIFDAFELRAADGTPVLLAPGQTWVHIIPAAWGLP